MSKPPHPQTWHLSAELFEGTVECETNPLSFIGLGVLSIGQALEPKACAGAYRISHRGQTQWNILFETMRLSHTGFDMPCLVNLCLSWLWVCMF